MTRRLSFLLIILVAAQLSILTLYPVNSTLTRTGLLIAIFGLWLGLLLLIWKHRLLRWSLLILPAVLALPLLLPSPVIDQAKLREDYLARMVAFTGTPYYWGGESSRGIDCSGLPRRALRDALLDYGLTHAHGGALRFFLEQWWFDTSARAMSQGYRGQTLPVGISGQIRTLDVSSLQPGDLAVTEDGVHVLAYKGGDEWIQADPGIGHVAVLNSKTDDNGWFRAPVTIHRWWLFQP